LAMLADR